MDSKSNFMKKLATKSGKIIITIIFAFIIWGVFTAALTSNNTIILGMVILLCAFFGWKSLNKITPKVFLWMSFMGWVVYFTVKGVLSAVIGVFVAPIKIGSMISEYAIKVVGKSAEYVKAGYDAVKNADNHSK